MALYSSAQLSGSEKKTNVLSVKKMSLLDQELLLSQDCPFSNRELKEFSRNAFDHQNKDSMSTGAKLKI